MGQGDPAAARSPRCPSCGQPVTWSGNATRPFCSVSCKLIDLGVWLDERYRLPGAALHAASAPAASTDESPPETDPRA